MRADIVNLRQFYSSRLGRRVKARLRQIALDFWPACEAEHIVGFGYAPPILRVLERGKPASITALMPSAQGAIYWPVHAENHSILGDEMRPPFAPASLHRVVVLHGFEHAARPDEFLRILWQLLAPGGRLLLVVPNRRGLWASVGQTPFSSGTPATLAQLRSLLHDAAFTLRETEAAFFAPPSSHPFWLRHWNAFEWLGRWCFPRVGGVWVVEAEKQIYAGIREPVVAAKRPAAWAQVQQGIPA